MWSEGGPAVQVADRASRHFARLGTQLVTVVDIDPAGGDGLGTLIHVDLETGADIPGDERITTYTYAVSQTDGAPRDRVAEQVVTDGDGAQITASRTYYDGKPEEGLPLGQLDAQEQDCGQL